MRKLVCDICGKELDERDCYDEDGYSQYVNVEIRNSRKYGAEYDLCNECYEDILKYADARKNDTRIHVDVELDEADLEELKMKLRAAPLTVCQVEEPEIKLVKDKEGEEDDHISGNDTTEP